MNLSIELECIRVFFLKAYSYSKDSGLRIFLFSLHEIVLFEKALFSSEIVCIHIHDTPSLNVVPNHMLILNSRIYRTLVLRLYVVGM